MLASIISFGLKGIDGFRVAVEVDVSNGLPAFDIVGLPDASVKESRERVRSAIRNSGFQYPSQRITVNLAPADIRKEGTLYDLPIALGLLCSTGHVHPEKCKDYVLLGELSLNGELRPVNGVLPMAIQALRDGCRRIILPAENAKEAAYIENLEVYGVSSLSECIGFLNSTNIIKPYKTVPWQAGGYDENGYADFSFIKGQRGAKRAMEIAAAGGHNALLIGPPGTGKTMLARGLNGILPKISFEEALEVSKIYSANGLLNSSAGIIAQRPFRSPHQTSSSAALAGGGSKAMPGEVSLAHYGVLFLDELPEFNRSSLDSLRQPLEDGKVTISRVNASATYPAQFMLVAAMNPCPCGHFGSNECTCPLPTVRRYRNRISGPLLDRIDMHIEMGPVSYKHLAEESVEEISSDVRKRVNEARQIQVERYSGQGIYCNAQLNEGLLKQHCQLDDAGTKILKSAFNKMNLSARAYGRILKLSRTIADLEGARNIQAKHIAEAVHFRSLDKKYWSD